MFLSYSLPLLPDATICMTFGEAFGAMFCATLDMTFSITFSTMFFSVTFGAMFDTAFCAIFGTAFGSTFWPDTRYALPKSAFTASHYSKISAHHDFLRHFHKIKFAVTVKNRIFAIPIRNGALAERLGTGLQNLLQRFDSARHLSTSLSENPRGIFFDNSSFHLHKILDSVSKYKTQSNPHSASGNSGFTFQQHCPSMATAVYQDANYFFSSMRITFLSLFPVHFADSSLPAL